MSYRPQRTFNGTQGNPSTDTMGPEQLSHDIDELCKMFNPTSVHSDGSAGGVTADNLNFTGLDINEIGGVASGDIKAIRVKMNGDIEYTTDGETYHPAFAREENYLPLAGGTMSGTLNMNNNKITNLATPEAGSDPATKNYTDAIRTALEVAIALKAPIESPTFTGTPTAPTPSTADSSTQIATTAFTQAVAAGVAGNTYSKADADAKFETIANANKLVKNVSYNSGTGTFTIVTQDGTTKSIDTNIEKIPVSVSIIQSGSTYKLRITNEDGSYSECDVSAMFNAITFVDSAEIDFTETTNQDGSKNVTASIKPGSIVGSKLDPDYKDVLDALVDRAEAAETNAQNSADNAADSATAAAGSASAASGSASAAAGSVTSASQYASAAEGFKNQASNSATNAANSASAAAASAASVGTQASDAEAAARGTRNGVPVGPDDEFYHDNAEYYKDQAAAIVGITIDDALSTTSANPVENRVITNALANAGGAFVAEYGVTTYADTLAAYNNGKSIVCFISSSGEYAPLSQYQSNTFYFYTVLTDGYRSIRLTSTGWALSTGDGFMRKGVDYVTAGQKSGTTLGSKATAEGYYTTASGSYSHAEGNGTTASGSSSHAEGGTTTASYEYAHAEGYNTTASEKYSHAEGYATTASGRFSHAEGNTTTASGYNSHAEGSFTIANHHAQHVFGSYNIADPSTGAASTRGNYLEIVGNGTASDRSNARTLDWSGNEVLAGKLTVGAGPTNNMDVATKQYVDTEIAGIDALPSQTGNDGMFLMTDGSDASWAAVEPEVFTVTVTKTSNPQGSGGYIYSGDKTFAEITTANTAGKIIRAKISGNTNAYFNLISLSSGLAKFQSISAGDTIEYLSCNSSNEWSASYTEIQAKITASGILKGNGAGGVTAAVAGTDYVASPEVLLVTIDSAQATITANHTFAEITAAVFAGKSVMLSDNDGNSQHGAVCYILTGIWTDMAIFTALGRGGIMISWSCSSSNVWSGESFAGGVKNNTSTSASLTANTSLITANTLRYHTNRTTSVAAADTNYTTYMARGEALNSADTNPTVNGAISWTYA